MDDINKIIIDSVRDTIIDEEEYLRRYTSYGLFHISENILTDKICRMIVERINKKYSNENKFHLHIRNHKKIQSIHLLSRGIKPIRSSFIFRNKTNYITLLDDIIRLSNFKDDENNCNYFVLLDMPYNSQTEDQRIKLIETMEGIGCFNQKIKVKQVEKPVILETRYDYRIRIKCELYFFEIL